MTNPKSRILALFPIAQAAGNAMEPINGPPRLRRPASNWGSFPVMLNDGN
jgi:hypothetical protein